MYYNRYVQETDELPLLRHLVRVMILSVMVLYVYNNTCAYIFAGWVGYFFVFGKYLDKNWYLGGFSTYFL